MFEMQDFSYCLSSELDQFTLRFKILDLQENRVMNQASLKLLQDPFLFKAQGQTQFYIICQPFADNKPLCLPCKTSFKQNINKRGDLEWNEWIIFPVPYSNLPITTQVAITIYEAYGPRHPRAVGGTTFQLFGKNKTIRKGKYKLHVWPDIEADGLNDCSTPAKISERTESDRLDKVFT
jgi:phosphatidylinositol 3-kinase